MTARARLHLVPCLLLVALGWNLAFLLASSVRSEQAIQPIGVCYATNGASIETTYVNVPSSGAYPIASEGSVEPIEGGFITHHTARFEYRKQRIYVPLLNK